MSDLTIKTTKQEPGRCEVHHTELKEYDFRGLAGLKNIYTCDECEQSLRSQQQEEYKLEQLQEKKNRYKRRQELAGVPARFISASLDTVITDTPAQQEILAVLRHFSETKGKEPNSLILAGRLGTGKTFAGYALINEWAIEDRSSLFVTALGLVRRIRDSWKGGELSESAVIKQIVNMSLLVLDEVGVQGCTANEQAIITDILNQRYEQMKPTVIIGNLTMDEFSTVLGERVIDRFREGGRVLSFTWESRRRNNP